MANICSAHVLCIRIFISNRKTFQTFLLVSHRPRFSHIFFLSLALLRLLILIPKWLSLSTLGKFRFFLLSHSRQEENFHFSLTCLFLFFSNVSSSDPFLHPLLSWLEKREKKDPKLAANANNANITARSCKSYFFPLSPELLHVRSHSHLHRPTELLCKLRDSVNRSNFVFLFFFFSFFWLAGFVSVPAHRAANKVYKVYSSQATESNLIVNRSLQRFSSQNPVNFENLDASVQKNLHVIIHNPFST